MTNQERKNSGYFNRPFDTALPALLGREKPRKPYDHENLPKVNNDELDGRDHINVHHHARTDLGLALSPYSEFALIHPQFGRFLTVQGFIAWLSNPNQPDSYRTIIAREVDASMRALGVKPHLPDFAYQYLQATWYKIKSHPKIERWMYDSNLRFEHYYLSNTVDVITKEKTGNIIRIRNKSAAWMINGMNELRNALWENREPNLEVFLPAHIRDNMMRARTKETDVILEGDLRREPAEGVVRRERTPEQRERARAKLKAAKQRKRERRLAQNQLTNPPPAAEVSEGSNLCQEIEMDPNNKAPVLCTLGIRDIYIVDDANLTSREIYLPDHQKEELSPEDFKKGVDAAMLLIDDLTASNKQITIGDIDLQFVTVSSGIPFLGLYRLNGITLLTRDPQASAGETSDNNAPAVEA